jgi:hypothetical protein
LKAEVERLLLPPAVKKEKKGWREELEPWMVETLEAALRIGAPIDALPGLIQVRKAKFTEWVDRGCEPDAPEMYQEFASRLMAARSEAALEGTKILNAHGLVDYKAKLAVLKAAMPETYSDKSYSKVDSTHTVNVKTSMDLSKLTDEEFKQYKELQEKAGG